MRAQHKFRAMTAALSLRSVLCAGCSALFAGLIGAAAIATAEEPRELVFLNWGQYTDLALVAKFEEAYNARVRMIYFEDEDARDQLLLESDGRGYDVAVVSGRHLADYGARGWLAPLDETNAPNLKYIEPRWRTIFPAAQGRAAPYLWGTLGIAYRTDLVPGGLHSWKQFFEPGAVLRNRISLSGDPGDTIGMALKSFDYSINSTDPGQLADAERLLLGQKPYVRAYSYNVVENAALVTGEVVAGMMYNGDALMLADHNPDIDYVVPDEGSNLWVDYLIVLEGSNHKEIARAFVNFLNEPANAAQLAETLHYATPNTAAKSLLPAATLADKRIYPADDVLARSEVANPLPPRAERRRSAIYAKVAY